MFGIVEAIVGAIATIAVDVGAAVLGAGLAGSVGLIGTEIVGASMIGLAESTGGRTGRTHMLCTG